jgi:hypothetical protein
MSTDPWTQLPRGPRPGDLIYDLRDASTDFLGIVMEKTRTSSEPVTRQIAAVRQLRHAGITDPNRRWPFAWGPTSRHA